MDLYVWFEHGLDFFIAIATCCYDGSLSIDFRHGSFVTIAECGRRDLSHRGLPAQQISKNRNLNANYKELSESSSGLTDQDKRDAHSHSTGKADTC